MEQGICIRLHEYSFMAPQRVMPAVQLGGRSSDNVPPA